jgi:hypothetical protein
MNLEYGDYGSSPGCSAHVIKVMMTMLLMTMRYQDDDESSLVFHPEFVHTVTTERKQIGFCVVKSSICISMNFGSESLLVSI